MTTALRPLPTPRLASIGKHWVTSPNAVCYERDLADLARLEKVARTLDKATPPPGSAADQLGWTPSVSLLQSSVAGLVRLRARLLDRVTSGAWFLPAVGVAMYVLAMLAFWSVLLRARPLWLLKIDAGRFCVRSRVFAIPNWLGGLKGALAGVLLLFRGFSRSDRVLDAWVAQYLATARENYRNRRTVSDRGVYVPCPVVLDGRTTVGLAPHTGPCGGVRQEAGLAGAGEGGAGDGLRLPARPLGNGRGAGRAAARGADAVRAHRAGTRRAARGRQAADEALLEAIRGHSRP